MVEKIVAWLVDVSRRFSFGVIALYLLLIAAGGYFAATHFAINTDVTKLLDETASWRQREIAFSKAFPQHDDLIVILIDGKNAVDTELAASELTEALKTKPDLFRVVRRPDASLYLQQNGLRLLPTDQLADMADGMIKAPEAAAP